jgi:hypothetical protein
MKKKFKMLMAYLKGFKKESIPFEITISETHIEDINIYYGVDITSNFESHLQTILELYTNELYDEGPGSVQSASDYFYVDGEIYPFENKIVFNQVRFTSYGTSDSGYEVYIDDYEEDDGMYSTFMEVRKFLEHEGIEDMTISYNGGGDSGYIESDYTSKNKNGQIDEDIEHICYDLLEEYGGWEINEGSQGNIVFTKDEISVNHEWNTEDDDSNEIDIEITEDSLP